MTISWFTFTIGRAVFACALSYFLYWAPPFLLLRAIPWSPRSIDGWFLFFTLQVMLFLAIASALRAPVVSAGRVGLRADGVGAVCWLLFAGALLGALVAMTVISTSDARSVGFTVANGLGGLASDFPHAGAAGGAIRNFILAPIFEEFLFRVLILGFLLRRAPPWLALVITTVIFASAHSSWILSGVIGLAYGLLYLRYRSVWLCVLAHGGENLLMAVGVPLAVAHLHEVGVVSPVRENLLVLQLCWLGVILFCVWMFLRSVIGKDRGKAMLLTPST